MLLLQKRVNKVGNQAATKQHLPLLEWKHEILVLKNKKRQKNKDVKWVKWIRITMDECFSTKKQWKFRIAKVRSMLE